jgi:glycosyltransferase involved in cell wall biosynthesis
MENSSLPVPSVAVLIPCYNEERTISKVIGDFQRVLPSAKIWVFDNASADRTGEVARSSGATVVASLARGKGNVVRHMFSTIDADIFIMVDGDSTYSAESAPALIQVFQDNSADMVVGKRCTPQEQLAQAYRPMHRFGNDFVCWLIRKAFNAPIRDIFSGYRVFSRAFVKSAPLYAQGFEIEIEMTLQALSKGYRVFEIDTPYGSRPEGSFSKLDTYKDGLLVIRAFGSICRDYRPGFFFGVIATFFVLLSLAAGVAPIADYLLYHYVYHLPLALLATGLAILGALSLCISFILETQLRYHNELHSLIRRNSSSPKKPGTPVFHES